MSQTLSSSKAETSAVCLPVPPPLSLYIHIPWCVRKCPYCDFNSHPLRTPLPEQDYLEALTRDLQAALSCVRGRRVHTVFIGGGTPSLLSAAAVDRLLSTVHTLLPLDPQAEITLEANPGTFEVEKFRAFRDAGINRLSLGVQSFNDRHLSALGRIHDGREARAALDCALTLFPRVNVDLMYGLPGQSVAEAVADLETALATGLSHVSTYHLTIEPHTLFYARPPKQPDEDSTASIEEEIDARLAAAGFFRYETSAAARPGHACQHNLNYWLFGDYLGIGAGAHGKLSTQQGITREIRFKQPRAYMEAAYRGDAVQAREPVAPRALPFEFMMNALRLREGFEPALFAERTGLSLTVVEPILRQAQARGLLQWDAHRIRATPLGQRFLNDLLTLFLPE
ncbi:radical SAM family heme chaperone HemW [Thiobacter aerophilum]|uniref:Heme chaperone HemW n=1 Tax=Thiobacter aerophilum TaxID=3121275 RepID=A0ABV0ECF6_9BURK